MDNKIYNEIIKDIEILNIFLRSICLEEVKFPQENEAKFDVELKYECIDFSIDDNTIEFYPKFDTKLTYQDQEMVRFKFTMRAIYVVKDISEFKDEYIKEFINRNLPINIWPYAREIISSITTKVGYPSLIIEPFRG